MVTAAATSAPLSGVLAPSPSAEQLAQHMLDAEDVHRTILLETIESGEAGELREAGRTACGSIDNLRAPIARFPRAVELSECPVTDAVGIWHTHPADGELRTPRHSLPDWGSVVFGWADASVVTGTQGAQAIVAGEDRAAMGRAFQEALGVDVTTKRGIMSAVLTGAIPDYLAALDRVEATMAPFVRQRPVNFPDLDARVDTLESAPVDGVRVHQHAGHRSCYQVDELLSPDVGNLRADARRAKGFFTMAGARAAEQGFDEAVGVIVGTIVSNWLFRR